MLTALALGVATTVPLVVGAYVGLRWSIPRPTLAALMAFGAGTMITAATTELFGPAFERLGGPVAGASLMVGAATYVVASHVLDRRLGSGAVGAALVLGAVLDGVPENAALGVSVGSGALVLAVAIAVGNTPEAVASGAALRDSSIGSRRATGLWTSVAVVLTVVTIAAHAGADVIGSSSVAGVQAFAGGATLAVLADTLLPQAYRDGGWWVGLATAAGFLLGFLLG